MHEIRLGKGHLWFKWTFLCWSECMEEDETIFEEIRRWEGKDNLCLGAIINCNKGQRSSSWHNDIIFGD